ncbi:transporter substrate-binding domain-containing protein [Aliivibrio logei]|uniref:histidine kinase n=2 Tax=Aliivibrio TaxID=511678 RepID=A0A1B9NWT3_ALILO|nr:transporter substrate-binding domain-containing protein [Aliivibrio logei]OCH19640.1 hypothetical protein A6E04_16590 [Aliivibrio logei]
MGKILNFIVILFLPAVAYSHEINLTPIEKVYIKKNPTISIAVLSESWSPYIEKTPVGEYNGIHIDYIKNITSIIGVKVKYNTFDSVDELLKSVAEGESDIAVGFSQTPERDRTFSFSVPFFTGSVAVWYRKTRAAYMPIQSLSWACVSGTIYCERLKEQGIRQIDEKKHFLEAINLVNEGEADAIIANYVTIAEYLNDSNIVKGTTKLPEWLEPESAGVIASKKNKILIDIINKVLNEKEDRSPHTQIESDNIYHQSDLLNLAYRNMNAEEQTIRYSLKEDSYPLFYRNDKGEITGYLFDFIKLIQARTGLKFKYVPSIGKTAWNSLSDGDIDLVPIAYPGENNDSNITLSHPYISITYRSIEKKDYVDANKPTGVLIASNNTKTSLIRSFFSNSTKTYDDVKSLLNDLELGEIRCAYLPSDLIEGVIAKDFTDHFSIGKSPDRIVDISFAVSKNNVLLSEVINGVLATVDHEELTKLKRGYRQFNVIYGYEKSQVYKVLFLFSCAVFLACLVIYFWLNNLKLQVKLKEKDAKQSESDKEWLQSIINELPSIIFIHDDKNRVLLSNCPLFQSDRCSACVFSKGQDEITSLKDNQKIITEDIIIRDTLLIDGCNLRFEQVDRVRKRITDPNTQRVSMLTVIHDITEQKKQESALITANDVAQEAIISRELFLASMSHELRTPIAGITGLLELLAKRVKGSEKKGIVVNISSSMRHLHLLVNDILDFSKLEAQQLSLELRDCHYLRELGDVFRLHNAAAFEKGIRFCVDIEPNPINVIKVDSLRLSQIVNNLLSNAVKFTEKGHVEARVSLNNEVMKVRICDTGLGMNDAQLETVFKPFTQADNSIARKYGGTGLGLNIVNELIYLMKGTFSIKSAEEVGTVIEFSIPIEVISYYDDPFKRLHIECEVDDSALHQWISVWTESEDKLPCIDKKRVKIIDTCQVDTENNDVAVICLNGNNKEKKMCDSDTCSISNDPLFIDELYSGLVSIMTEPLRCEHQALMPLCGTVLIAEDNQINRVLLMKQLEELGVVPVVTNNGKEALDKLRENPEKYDLLITDCHMPILDGFTLARKVRQEIVEFDNKVIIGCTAEDLRTSRLNGKTSGFDHMLFKPYGLSDLHSLLSQYLSRGRQDSKTRVLMPPPSLLNKFIELDDRGLMTIFIKTMKEDMTSLAEMSSQIEIQEMLHRIKGGAGSIGLESLTLLIDEISSDAFYSNKYEKGLEKLMLEMKTIIEDASTWYKEKND